MCTTLAAASEKRGFYSPLAAFNGGVHCPALSCCAPSPWVSIHAHPLGGAKHASLKDTAEPLYPGGSRELEGSCSDHSLLTTHHHAMRAAC